MILCAVFECKFSDQYNLFPHFLREETDHRPKRLHETMDRNTTELSHFVLVCYAKLTVKRCDFFCDKDLYLSTGAADPSSVGTAPAGRRQLHSGWILDAAEEAEPGTTDRDTP